MRRSILLVVLMLALLVFAGCGGALDSDGDPVAEDKWLEVPGWEGTFMLRFSHDAVVESSSADGKKTSTEHRTAESEVSGSVMWDNNWRDYGWSGESRASGWYEQDLEQVVEESGERSVLRVSGEGQGDVTGKGRISINLDRGMYEISFGLDPLEGEADGAFGRGPDEWKFFYQHLEDLPLPEEGMTLSGEISFPGVFYFAEGTAVVTWELNPVDPSR